METLLHDVRYAARKLLRTPGFTFVAVLTLALAIGATTALFSIIDGVLLRPLSYQDPARLVRITSTGRDGKGFAMSAPDFMDYRSQSHDFEAMAAVDETNSNLTQPGEQPLRLSNVRVGAEFFRILGVQAQRGRGFLPDEDRRGGPRVVVLSDRLWRSRFNADPTLIGREISIDGNQFTVIGVAPPKFTYPTGPDVWTPFVFSNDDLNPDNRGAHYFRAIGRVRAGIPVATANNELAAIAARLARQYPESNTTIGAEAMPLQESIVGNVRPALLAMFGAVGFVLLIACANVANLLLVRAASRESEIAVRTALGAGRGRLVRQLVTESVLLALTGAVIGTLLASSMVSAVVSFGPRGLPRLDEIGIDARVLLFAVLVALVTGVLFGLVPALHAARPDVAKILREGARGSSRGAARKTRSALVITEMALAVVLVVGAGLLIRSFVALVHVDPGFHTENVVTFDLSLPELKYANDAPKRLFVSNLTQQLQQLPGTQSVAVSFGRPLSNLMMRTSFEVAGMPPSTADNRRLSNVMPVSPEFFQTMGIPLVKGRIFSAAEDRTDAPKVVVVNEEFVRKYFPNENPIGKVITLGIDHTVTADTASHYVSGGEIIGVVKNVKQRGLASEAYPATYVPYGTLPIGDLSFLVRSSASTAATDKVIRARVHDVDPDLPINNLTTMQQAVSDSVAQPRFYTVLLGAFALLALLLAALGIYGVISYTVSQRTRELGIRLALGATHGRVVRLILQQGMSLAMIGVGAGLVGAYWLTHLIASLLFGVSAVDPLTFAGVAVVLLGTAALASYVPARRAAGVDPVISMRND